MGTNHETVLARIESLYRMLFSHSGYGEMSIEIRYLRKHEKEVLIRCGKQYRFVVPYECGDAGECEDCACAQGAEEKGGAGVRGSRGKK